MRPAGACALSRIHVYFFFLFFSTTAYLRGLVTCCYYAGIHVPADRENCDYLQRPELFLAIRRRDSTLLEIPFVLLFFSPFFTLTKANSVPRGSKTPPLGNCHAHFSLALTCNNLRRIVMSKKKMGKEQ